jgi:thiol-disulfide isomerase/thioredoxin
VAEQPSSKGSGRRYSTFVGVAFLILIVVATVNTIRTQSGGTLGVDGAQRGMPLSEFAVPNALPPGPLDKDANVYQDDCSTSQNPCPKDARRPSACQIPRKGAIRVCDLFNRPLVLSFWFTRGANCLPTQDALNAVSEKYRGRVNFLSIDVRDDPSSVRSIATDHGWTMPVGYDRDGAVSDLYRVGGCPTVAFAYPGGILDFAKASIAALSQPPTESGSLRAGIERDVKTLLRQTRAREAESR